LKLKIKKGDTALVIAGADKGKKSKVLDINPSKLKILLQGVRVQTHFDKKEGIQKKEAWIDYSNVSLFASANKKPSKTKNQSKAKK